MYSHNVSINKFQYVWSCRVLSLHQILVIYYSHHIPSYYLCHQSKTSIEFTLITSKLLKNIPKFYKVILDESLSCRVEESIMLFTDRIQRSQHFLVIYLIISLNEIIQSLVVHRFRLCFSPIAHSSWSYRSSQAYWCFFYPVFYILQ